MRSSCLLMLLLPGLVSAEIIIAEGEAFRPADTKGWKLTHQNDSYGSHSYGGMWMTHGACLGAPADSVESVAVQSITVPAAGKYRVWSKYQAPPYFHYQHQIEVVQNGKVVFKSVYGKRGTPGRLWSFSGESDELWWPWGVDHDCAEAPTTVADLVAGPAEIRLTTVENPKPAGNRYIDFVVLTTKQESSYEGFKPYQVGSPFSLEALATTKLFLRFKNSGEKAAQLTISRSGHFQPNYGGATTKVPAKAVEPGQWSEWVNIGPFCRLVHDEGLKLDLDTKTDFVVEVARDAAGKDGVGGVTIKSGEWIVIPLEITWKKDAVVKSSRAHALEIIAESKKWRHANGGKKPQQIAFYGAFSGNEDWVHDLKHTLGYNTLLPDKYEHLRRDGLYAHFGSIPEVQRLAKLTAEKDRVRVISFGDEIHLGKINYKDPKLNEKFRAWIKARKLTKADLGVEPDAAVLTDAGNNRLSWYSNLFNEEERFAAFRATTEEAKKLFGPQVLTGANYSPHHLALCYGPVYQWVDIFKHQGMNMFWGEDYIFSVPEAPQILSWMFAQMRCATKYHNHPIHFYVMPHAPGQEPGYYRKCLLTSIGYGSAHIDNFWVAPAERFTENYVGWNYREQFRVLSEGIFDTAEVEKLQVGGKVRPARVAVVTGKATDFHESRLMVEKAKDPFTKDCKNAPATLNQILCRKEQQMLFLALKQAQHAIDVITEDDIAELDVLKNYDVVYFAGEWVDRRIVAKLDPWVQSGGVLFASGGCGHRNEFDEAEASFLKLLGLKSITTEKNAIVLRTLLELPIMPEIDSITFDGAKIPAIGMKQKLVPDTAKSIGTWSDGSTAVTKREHGKGAIFAVGTLAGNSWMKTGTRVTPWARGGKAMLYNPTNFNASATKLVRLGVETRKPTQAVVCSLDGVEGIVLDHASGTLLTLVNWTNEPAKQVVVQVRVPFAPKAVRSVQRQKVIESKYADGLLTFTIDVEDADYVMVLK